MATNDTTESSNPTDDNVAEVTEKISSMTVSDDTKNNTGDQDDTNVTETATETADDTNVDPKLTTPQQQRILMKKIGYKMQIVGEAWYPISKKWYNLWIEYTQFTKSDNQITGGVDSLGQDTQRPGQIDNSDLADPDNEGALRKDLQEHLTHEWVHEEKWKLLVSWFGGGPAFERKVYEVGSGNQKEKRICVHPKIMSIIIVTKDNPKIDETKVSKKGFPPELTLKNIATEFEEELAKSVSKDNDEKKNDDSNGNDRNGNNRNGNNNGNNGNNEDNIPKVHIWARFGAVKDIYPIQKRIVVTMDDLKDEDDTRWVEIPDDYLKTTLEEVKFDEKYELAIEYRYEDNEGNNKWPLTKYEDDWKDFKVGDIIDALDAQDGWYEVVLRLIGKEGTDHENKIAVHYVGWNLKWDEWMHITDDASRIKRRNSESKGPHRPRQQRRGYNDRYSGGYTFSYYSHDEGKPFHKGVVGLRNLGNTCFMNSTIQCLAQSPWLTDYFLNGEYSHHINKKNPLGWKGRVATAWAHLLNDMFSDKYRVIAPRQFKEAIGEVAPRFTGYQQQDSQELLSFLLDGLHEDLNQIINKPGTETVESDGRDDSTVALQSWKTYLKRNQSIIVDLMQGQYKSRVECPDCDRVSITFDPYMFLSVPLPTSKYKVIEITWVNKDISKPPTVFGIKMNKYADIGQLKDKIGKQFNVSKDELFVCDVWKSAIHRELRTRDNVSDINRRSDDIFVYHSPKIEYNETNNNEENNNEEENNENNEENNENNENNDNNEDDAPPVHAAAEDPVNDGVNGDIPAGDPAAGGDGGGAGEVPQNNENAGNAGNAGDGGNNAQPQDAQQRGQARFSTYVVTFSCRTQQRNSYHNGAQYNDESVGYPLLVTFDTRQSLPMRYVRDKMWELTKPFVVDDNIDINSNELPFVMSASWGYNNHISLGNSEDLFNLNQKNMKFHVHFNDSQQYKNEYYDRSHRPRDESAPQSVDPRTGRMVDDDDDDGRGAITLQQCIDAYIEEETLSEDDAWYCSQCKDFKMARKKLDLWNSPDLLIIHLKRFSYTRQWRDRINTLVKFPIKNLDLSPYLVEENAKKKENSIYDLYAVSNHMGGLGGGHYTAYALNLDNEQWYYLDDSRASEAGNSDGICSSAAYVLYYKKRYPAKLHHRASRVLLPTDENTPNNGINEMNNPNVE